MFAVLLALLPCGINWIVEGAFVFTQKPNSTEYFLQGKDAVLEWKYSVDDRANEFQFVSWTLINGSQRGLLLYENATGYVTYGSKFPAFVERVNRTGQATLVIKNMTFKDSDILILCSLIHQSGDQDDSSVKFVVTGQSSVHPQVQFASVGSSVDLICKATAVPKQSFSWFTYTGQTRIPLAGNDQSVTSSSTTGLSTLTFKSVADYNEGYYTCDATANVNQPNFVNVYLELLEPLKLDVTFSPGKPILTAVNESQVLCCPVIGYPPPIVTWEKNGTKLQEGENKCLTIASVKNYHLGNYSCIATDGKTTIDPIVLSLVEKEKPVPDQLTLSGTDGTSEKPAKLEWEPLAGATYYVVNVDGSDIYRDTVIGARTSLEIHYNTLVMKSDEQPGESEICAGVTAFSSNAGVLGKAPKCQKLMVKKPDDVPN